MEPVLILQFMADDGPAYLGTWLRRHRIEADVRLAEAGYRDAVAAFAAAGGEKLLGPAE